MFEKIPARALSDTVAQQLLKQIDKGTGDPIDLLRLQTYSAELDVRESEDFRATSLETLRQMVVAGLGITLLPELAVEPPFGSQRGMTIRQFTKPAPTRTVGAVWRKSSTRAAAIAAVCGVVESCLAKGESRRPP